MALVYSSYRVTLLFSHFVAGWPISTQSLMIMLKEPLKNSSSASTTNPFGRLPISGRDCLVGGRPQPCDEGEPARPTSGISPAYLRLAFPGYLEGQNGSICADHIRIGVPPQLRERHVNPNFQPRPCVFYKETLVEEMNNYIYLYPR